MNGYHYVQFLNHDDEIYCLNLPNVYARGILFGTMFIEYGDKVIIKCEKTDLICEIEFKTKVNHLITH
jgi:hypothetical protein